jgi:hypothetical protein
MSMYLDGSAESGGDLAPVTLDAGPDVARNPYELQLATGVVGAVHSGLGGEGVLVDQGLGRFLRDGQGGHFRELLEGGDGERAKRPATAGGESEGGGGGCSGSGEEREGKAEGSSSGGGGHGAALSLSGQQLRLGCRREQTRRGEAETCAQAPTKWERTRNRGGTSESGEKSTRIEW